MRLVSAYTRHPTGTRKKHILHGVGTLLKGEAGRTFVALPDEFRAPADDILPLRRQRSVGEEGGAMAKSKNHTNHNQVG